ncbi:hypothetical protein U1769_23530 [Sphingomonas sp. ZT3P38]|uniref:hypothetical protein n=1 Tax=Parasphingomonas zepuensis TaxID=3096161 RepID=UPI002FC9F84C
MENVDPDLVDYAIAFGLVGVALGLFFLRYIPGYLVACIGVAAILPVVLLNWMETTTGCSGGGCVGSMFLLIILAPLAVGGAGLIGAGVLGTVHWGVFRITKMRWLAVSCAAALALVASATVAHLRSLAEPPASFSPEGRYTGR